MDNMYRGVLVFFGCGLLGVVQPAGLDLKDPIKFTAAGIASAVTAYGLYQGLANCPQYPSLGEMELEFDQEIGKFWQNAQADIEQLRPFMQAKINTGVKSVSKTWKGRMSGINLDVWITENEKSFQKLAQDTCMIVKGPNNIDSAVLEDHKPHLKQLIKQCEAWDRGFKLLEKENKSATLSLRYPFVLDLAGTEGTLSPNAFFCKYESQANKLLTMITQCAAKEKARAEFPLRAPLWLARQIGTAGLGAFVLYALGRRS